MKKGLFFLLMLVVAWPCIALGHLWGVIILSFQAGVMVAGEHIDDWTEGTPPHTPQGGDTQ